MKAVVFFSGGIVSWAAAKRTVARYGADNTTLLFTDTLMEHPDLYRFLPEAAENVGAPLVWIRGNRNIWDVFDDEGMLGNSRIDPCSRVLKREAGEAWINQNCDPGYTALVFGIDWTETHRFDGDPLPGQTRRRGVKPRYNALGWPYVHAPMIDPPYMDRRDISAWLQTEGLVRSRSYDDGFVHDNCGGGCIKGGKGHFAHLYRVRPTVYAEWEAGEQRFNDKRPGKPFQTILRDEVTGQPTKPLSLRQLRERIEGGGQIDMFDIGGCGCFVDAN